MNAFFFDNYPPEVVFLPLILLYCAWRYSTARDKWRTDRLLAISLLIIPIGAASHLVLQYMSALRPLKYDLYIYRLDRGFEPGFAIWRVAERHPWLQFTLVTSYSLYTLAIVAVFAAYLWGRTEPESNALLKTFALNLVAALPIYWAIPVSGPRFAFPDYPAAVPLGVPHLLAIHAAPNGIPSVHLSTALLVAWFARHWLWGRVAGVVYVILTVAVTLGSGQHYLFDLIAAVPYTLLVYHLAFHPSETGMRRESRPATKPAPEVEESEQQPCCPQSQD